MKRIAIAFLALGIFLTCFSTNAHICGPAVGRSRKVVIDEASVLWEYLKTSATQEGSPRAASEIEVDRFEPTLIWMNAQIEKRSGDIRETEHQRFVDQVKVLADQVRVNGHISYNKFLQLSLQFSVLMSLPRKSVLSTEVSVRDPWEAVGAAMPLIERAVQKSPHGFFVPTEKRLDLWFFVRTRHVPVYYLELFVANRSEEGELMSPHRRFLHDLEHAFEMSARDCMFHNVAVLQPWRPSPLVNSWLAYTNENRASWANDLDREARALSPEKAMIAATVSYDIFHEVGEAFDPLVALNYLAPGRCRFDVIIPPGQGVINPISRNYVSFLEGRVWGYRRSYIDILARRADNAEIQSALDWLVSFWWDRIPANFRSSFCAARPTS